MNAYSIVNHFEETISNYAGARYGVAVESCTAALFLSCLYKQVQWAHIPKYTYPGVACSIIHAGGKVCFTDEAWSGIYRLRPYEIYDSALRFQRGMYIRGSLYCLSFHAKKHLPIGRGGMILTDDKDAYKWLRKARFDGRNECSLKEDNIDSLGFNMYLTPEQAARGLMLFGNIENECLEDLDVEKQAYVDLSKIKVYGGRNG
jgi:dTDP-4-amino-4,6-dideoxygalactose transaminase